MVRTARDSETGVSWVPANARRPPARRPHPQARRFSSAIMSRSGDLRLQPAKPVNRPQVEQWSAGINGSTLCVA